MSEKILCFHHNDMDGRCSAAIVNKFHTKKKDICTFVETDYNLKRDYSVIDKETTVYIVDFSLPVEEFREVVKKAKKVVWIDHHKSAIQRLENTEIFELPGLREIGTSGCELTWEYFSQGFLNVPTVVAMLGRYDVWDFTKYEKDALFSLQEYCRSIDTNPESEIWDLWLNFIIDSYPFTEVSKGSLMLEYKRKVQDDQLKNWGFEITIDGHKAYAVNIGKSNTDLFRSVADKYDLFVGFVYINHEWMVSLRTTNEEIDCSEMAMKRGGGGHKGAAMFTTKEFPFWDKE